MGRVSFMDGVRLLSDDDELLWFRPFDGPLCCTLTFYVQAIDPED